MGKPTEAPTDSPTDPGTKSPSKTPTPEPTEDCWYQLGVCDTQLQELQEEGCEPVECEETTTVTSESTATYAATIPLDVVEDDSTVEAVDSWTLDRIYSTGLIDESVGLMVSNGEFVVPVKDGSYVRTCVAYSSDGAATCDSTDLFCSAGATYGYGPQMANNIVLALERADLQHPECPSGCNDNGWYQGELEAAGVSDKICLVGNAVYTIGGDGTKTFTCVGLGDADDLCTPADVVCSGISGGRVTYGYPQNIINTLVHALSQDDKVHPQCPYCCSCSN